MHESSKDKIDSNPLGSDGFSGDEEGDHGWGREEGNTFGPLDGGDDNVSVLTEKKNY